MKVAIVVWAIWFLSEVFLNRRLRSKSEDRKENDQRSLNAIWITISVSITLGVVVSEYYRVVIGDAAIVPSVGLALIVVGMIIRFAAIRSLGSLFTVDLAICVNHKIIRDGLYRWLRHPSYSGLLLSFVGFGMSLNNWFSLIVICTPITMAMLNRIRIEEALLSREFGQEYLDYMKQASRLIPWIY